MLVQSLVYKWNAKGDKTQPWGELVNQTVMFPCWPHGFWSLYITSARLWSVQHRLCLYLADDMTAVEKMWTFWHLENFKHSTAVWNMNADGRLLMRDMSYLIIAQGTMQTAMYLWSHFSIWHPHLLANTQGFIKFMEDVVVHPANSGSWSSLICLQHYSKSMLWTLIFI